MMEGHAAYTDARRGSAAPAGRGRGVDNRPAWMTRPDEPPALAAPAPAAPGYPQEAGTIVHLSRRLCGAFTSRRLDCSTATYYNGWYGFVRPDAATHDADDLFLHPSDAADDYNPAVGDRVNFRRGTHNGRAKAVEVRLIMDPHEPAVAPCWAAPTRAVSPGQAPAMRGENRHVSLDKPRSSGRAPRPKVRFDPALEAAKPQWDTTQTERSCRALAEARNAFDQTRIATQSCPYKFTTVLLKTSAHLVKKSWTDFKAYVESHGVRWSVRRRATGSIGGGPGNLTGHEIYAVDLSFDPHGVEAAGRLEAAPEALRVAKARGRVAASVDAPSLLSGFPFQGSGDAVPPPPRPRLDVPAPASRGAKDLAAHNTPGPAWAPPASARRTPKPVAGQRRDRSAVVAPDPSRAPTETTSKYWGVSWQKRDRRWKAQYQDADGKKRFIGSFDTQEEAAHAYNAAIRALPPDVQARRKTNPVDATGALVPRTRTAPGHGVASRKRRRDESAAPPPAPSRRRVVSAPPPRERDDVDLDRTAAYLETVATPDDADGFRAVAGLALACLDAVANVASV